MVYKELILFINILLFFLSSYSVSGIMDDEKQIQRYYKAINLILESLKEHSKSGNPENCGYPIIPYFGYKNFKQSLTPRHQENRTPDGLFITTSKFKDRDKKNNEFLKTLCTPMGGFVFVSDALSSESFQSHANFMKNEIWDLRKLTKDDECLDVFESFNQITNKIESYGEAVYYEVTRVGSESFKEMKYGNPTIYKTLCLTDEQKKKDETFFQKYQGWVKLEEDLPEKDKDATKEVDVEIAK